MFLKKIEIQGFKSFADRILLELNMGVTAIVGPNGSGKSNISDAVRWVLGEQSVKSLRGSKMEDVIFAGTEHRKPSGFAEVTLIFDNQDFGLPMTFSEIAVTRRVYRSGESEFLINRNHCRLKDINELFFDTGIGKEGYTIIGQGKVDEILNNKPEDRRNIFEEAAGIMKYRVKKQEAVRKLEATDQNILRIKDIILELEVQLGILKEQEFTARKYLQLRDELKRFEVGSYVNRIRKYLEELETSSERYTAERDSLEEQKSRLLEIERSVGMKNQRNELLEQKLTEGQDALFQVETDFLNHKNETSLNKEKIDRCLENTYRLESEILNSGEKKAVREKEVTALEKKRSYLTGELERYNALLEKKKSEYANILSTLNESDRAIEELKQSSVMLQEKLYDKKNLYSGKSAELESFSKNIAAIEKSVLEVVLDIDQNLLMKDELSEKKAKIDGEVKKLHQFLQSVSQQRIQFSEELAEIEKKKNAVLSELHAGKTRLKILSDMESSFEGFNVSVKRILTKCKVSPEFAEGIYGPVASLIVVPAQYETAIGMVLGQAQQNIIVEDEQTAQKAVRFLKQTAGGRATFLPLTSVKGNKLEGRTLDLLSVKKGYIGVASDLIEYQARYEKPVLQLLGKTVVADNLENAVALAKAFHYAFRIVTLDGDILTTGGAISGGSTEKRDSGILSRNREIPELHHQIAVLETTSQKQTQEFQKKALELDTVKKEIIRRETEIQSQNLELVSLGVQISNVDEKLRTQKSRNELYKMEKAEAQNQKNLLQQTISELADACEAMSEKLALLRSEIAESDDRNKSEQKIRDDLLADISDFNVSVASIGESLKAVYENIERLKTEMESSERSVSRKQLEIQSLGRQIEKYKQDNMRIEKTISELETKKKGKSLQLASITAERKALQEEIQTMAADVSELNARVADMQSELNRFEIKTAKMNADLENTQNRLWEEYELTYHNAAEMIAGNENPGETAAMKRILELKEEIKALGYVNILAIDEYIETKKRHEKMVYQQNDLEEAGEKLRKVIDELVLTMQKNFQEQFEKINKNFGIVFRELFSGGHAQLILTDENNILEAGVEIEIQLPGKKMQNMMLYSGGERAMTAIALIFAMLKLKPAPFCFLDEIESALDEANVERFSKYIRGYCNTTQFIMVTHRKGTMEGSNVLYGVTMQERGVSKVVSLKLGA